MFRFRVLALVFSLFAGTAFVQARVEPSLDGTVKDPAEGAIVGATVELASMGGDHRQGTVTDESGHFRFANVPAGTYRLSIAFPGFARLARRVEIETDLSLDLQMALASFVQEVVVQAAMPELTALVEVEGRRLEDQVAQDTGEFLREQPEMFSTRRGAINMDPIVRGLQESELAMFVDGTRTFAAGPARMDSDISHISPHAVQTMQVVKGPYALSWGAGALSAVQLETFRPDFGSSRELEVDGRLGYNYGENGNTSDGYVMAWGSNDRFRFTASHNTRLGNDYADGDGNVVPADYASYDTRWDVGFLATPETRLTYSGGYQEQRDIDYPGRILDATYFETQSHAVEMSWERGSGRIDGQFYANLKNHLMNNDEKPTAQPMPGRVPPFGLDIALPAESDTYGGRASYRRETGNVTWKAGFDFFQSIQNAERTISRRDSGMTLLQDVVWPDARIKDAGGYLQVIYNEGGGQVGGTLRFDRVGASAGDVSDFFLDNTEGALDHDENNTSAALSASYRLRGGWLLNAGVGRAVRTANALELYSDRFPAVKFQNAAEFMGNPGLAPEKSFEWNLGTSYLSSRFTLGLDVFGRRIGDYITVEPAPDIPKRLPLSPDLVYRYVNGDAKFYGYELQTNGLLNDHFSVRGALSYVWAEDETFGEPAFGIAPLKLILAGRAQTRDGRRWVELEVTAAGEQTRVAEARLERPTPAWQRVDLRAGFELGKGLGLRLGATNLGNETYATHLNSLNPFTRTRIAEPGRSFYAGVYYGF